MSQLCYDYVEYMHLIVPSGQPLHSDSALPGAASGLTYLPGGQVLHPKPCDIMPVYAILS